MRLQRTPYNKYSYLSRSNVTGGTTIEFSTKWARASHIMWMCVGYSYTRRYASWFTGAYDHHPYINKSKNFKR